MRTVPLHGKVAAGRVTLIDDGDYESVIQHRWHVWQTPGSVPYPASYVPLGDGGCVRTRMHVFLTGNPLTDHHDGNGLNNQRHNLRDATDSQNGANKRSIGGASPYKGVWTRKGKWYAECANRHVGTFASETDAAIAYDAAAREHWGPFARLNFPDRSAGEVGVFDYLHPDPRTAATAGPHVPDRAGTSRFMGVFRNSRNDPAKPWQATISSGGKARHLGSYVAEMDAALAYDAAAIAACGESAWLNFPQGVPQEMRDELRAEQEAVNARIRAGGAQKLRELRLADWAEREPHSHACARCGKEFPTRDTRPVLYCGGACQRAAKRQREREAAEQPEPTGPGTQPCAVCGRRFLPKRSFAIYCGDHCARQAHEQRKRERELEGRLF